jgi:putative Holliday junction resolvase
LALSDPLRITSTALEVVERNRAVNRIGEIVVQQEVTQIVVGLPVTLAGREGAAAQQAREFAAGLSEVVKVPIAFIDERFTTATAERVMLEAGTKRGERRQARDKVAASVILRAFLDRGR